MKKGVLTYNKNGFAKWLLTLAVLLGISACFSFAVPVNAAQQKPQTEMGCSSVKNRSSKSVTYGKAKEVTETSSKNTLLHPYQSASLPQYNQQIIIKLHCVAAQCLQFETAAAFIQLKTIPTASEEDHFRL